MHHAANNQWEKFVTHTPRVFQIKAITYTGSPLCSLHEMPQLFKAARAMSKSITALLTRMQIHHFCYVYPHSLLCHTAAHTHHNAVKSPTLISFRVNHTTCDNKPHSPSLFAFSLTLTWSLSIQILRLFQVSHVGDHDACNISWIRHALVWIQLHNATTTNVTHCLVRGTVLPDVTKHFTSNSSWQLHLSYSASDTHSRNWHHKFDASQWCYKSCIGMKTGASIWHRI